MSWLAMGRVVAVSRLGLGQLRVAEVEVTRQKLDNFLKAFWPETEKYWAATGQTEIGKGDVVLLRPVPEKSRIARQVTAEVVQRVYASGALVDPITKRPLTSALEPLPRHQKRLQLIKDSLQKAREQAKFQALDSQ